MVTERRLETAQGELLATVQQVSFLRGDGGYSLRDGGQPSDAPLPALQPVPEERARTSPTPGRSAPRPRCCTA